MWARCRWSCDSLASASAWCVILIAAPVKVSVCCCCCIVVGKGLWDWEDAVQQQCSVILLALKVSAVCCVLLRLG